MLHFAHYNYIDLTCDSRLDLHLSVQQLETRLDSRVCDLQTSLTIGGATGTGKKPKGGGIILTVGRS